jgi:hypothetical protein
VEPVRHFGSKKTLIVEIEKYGSMPLQRCPLAASTLDATILAQWRPAALQAVIEPILVGNVLRIIRKVITCTVHKPIQCS